MPKSITALTPTYSVRIQPDGQVVGTRLTYELANTSAVLFNRFRKYSGQPHRRAEILPEDETVRWSSLEPVAVRPRAVRRCCSRPV